MLDASVSRDVLLQHCSLLSFEISRKNEIRLDRVEIKAESVGSMDTKQTVLAISYSDYQIEKGGVNKVLLAHQRMMFERGYDFVYVYPVNQIAQGMSTCWHLMTNGRKEIRVFSTGELISLLQQKEINDVFLHHLMRIDMEELSKLLDALQGVTLFYYIHDYYAICNQYNLMRNGTQFCGIFNRNESDCSGCAYFKKKYESDKIRKFFRHYSTMKIVAPSDAAKSIWVKAYPDTEENVIVIYHQKLLESYTGNKQSIGDRKINVAYVGTCCVAKGWDDWLKLVETLPAKAKETYNFFVFGNPKKKNASMKTIRVDFRDGENAMVEALRARNIDVVFLGSKWPETYAYTFYEAFAENAFILTNQQSGNICDQIKQRGNGLAYKSLEELLSWLSKSEDFKQRLNDFKLSEEYGPSNLVENDSILSCMNRKEHDCRDIDRAATKIKKLQWIERMIGAIDCTYIGRIILGRLNRRS